MVIGSSLVNLPTHPGKTRSYFEVQQVDRDSARNQINWFILNYQPHDADDDDYDYDDDDDYDYDDNDDYDYDDDDDYDYDDDDDDASDDDQID